MCNDREQYFKVKDLKSNQPFNPYPVRGSLRRFRVSAEIFATFGDPEFAKSEFHPRGSPEGDPGNEKENLCIPERRYTRELLLRLNWGSVPVILYLMGYKL